jgi:murein DD-endopeptidase MepM/ murein hydrolase activator NlpD
MKIYSSSKGAKKNKTKLLYSLIAIASIGIIVLSVVLTAVFSKNESKPVVVPPIIETPSDDTSGGATVDKPVVDKPVVDEPTVKDPVLDTGSKVEPFSLPIENASVIREAALDKLVYMPSLNMWKTHSGVDFEASENASVKAIASGKVESVEETTLEGVVVTISHEDGLTSIYKSLASASVSVGDVVFQGTTIGVAGTMLTEKADGVHLHLEMTLNGELVDPLLYLDAEIDK